MNKLPPFTTDDRLLVLAPHPDDEALAAGGLLQRAVAAGAETRVIFLTDGDNNPWPQRFVERRWRVSGTAARSRWGALRRKEARASLLVLGHIAGETDFWSLPDQGLTGLLLAEGDPLAGRLGEAMSHWKPTHLAAPSAYDRHPDHSATGLAVDIVLRRLKRAACPVPLLLSYVVHGDPRPAHSRVSRLRLNDEEVGTKRSAILCHLSQILLSRTRFLAHARREERFLVGPGLPTVKAGNTIRGVHRHQAGLCIDLGQSFFKRLLPARDLCVLAESEASELSGICLPVPSGKDGALLVPEVFPGELVERVFVKLAPMAGLYSSTRWECLEVSTMKALALCGAGERRTEPGYDLVDGGALEGYSIG